MSSSGDRDAPGARGVSGARPPLSPEEWRLLEPMLDAVLDAAPARRAALVAELSGGDDGRQAELERLVAECERKHPLLDARASDRFAGAFDDEAPPMPEMLAGRYRVLREAGRGGMAIVYLARDLKHGRDVAVKIVRPELAASIGRARFVREIEIAAGLRHPHIVPLYDSGEVTADAEAGASFLYYVMPYETGRSLRERLEQEGVLPVADTLLILRDVCEALSHAHQHGIVHRDIKPENVLVSERHALVTDFGVARAVTAAAEMAPGGAGSTALGTPAYMAPEQRVRGARVDHRADVYAVGVLAYETLTGALPFEEPDSPRSAADVAVAIDVLRRRRPDAPAALVDAMVRCLANRPDDRWQTADDLLAHLASIPVARTGNVAAPARRRMMRAALLAAAVAMVWLVALSVARIRGGRGEAAPLHLGRASQLTSDRGLEVQPSISPDGKQVAYAAGHSLRMRIAVRPAAGGPARWLTTDATNAWLPRWSPDGARILFLSRGGVFSVPVEGGAVREEVASRLDATVRSAAWSADGREIAYVRGDSLLARAVGSGRTRFISAGPDLHSCRWSPDGGWIACVSGNSFYVTVGSVSGVGPMFGNLAPSRIVIVPAAGGRPVSVTDSVSLNQSPVWSQRGGTLYFVSNRNGPRDVYAVDVHARVRRARELGEAVRVTTGMGAQSIDLSADGARIVYAVYSSTANVWALPIPAQPSARPASATPALAVPVTSGNQTVEGLRVSVDGRWLVYDSDLGGNSDVYRLSLAGGDAERLTRGPSDNFRGALSPNGRELAYHSFQTGSRNIFLLTLDGGPPRRLTRSSGRQLAMANWSPDGTALSFFDLANADVLVMRRDRRGAWSAPRIVARNAWRPEWSPDGGTIAFVSPRDGGIGLVSADSGPSRDLYVPGDGDPLPELALFDASGRELYFKTHDSSGRASFWSVRVSGGRPRPLVRFDDPAWASNRFDFASDGRRLYFTVEDRQSDVWVAEVVKR